MSNRAKGWLIAAGAMVLVGFAVFTGALSLCGWDLTGLNTDDSVSIL